MKAVNEIRIQIPALSVNEGSCRALVGAFCAQADEGVYTSVQPAEIL